ncbi:hypothetical protein MBLNU457_6135t1 [Dothideomycetes sp. NU457]
MSEIDTRTAPSRGRSSTRGGRGGLSRGGPRGGHRQTNGSATESFEPSIEDQGELGELKKQYGDQLGFLKEMFPDWTDVDLVFALQETDGDLSTTIDRISEGHVSQFSEIKKPKDRARSKAKEASTIPGADVTGSTVRGGRGRGGLESTRGGRGRGDRGRGGARGGRGGAITTNGPPRDVGAVSVPTTESSAWGSAPTDTATTGLDSAPAATSETTNQGGWGDVVTADATPAAASEGAKSTLLPDGGPKKTWASMFAQPKPVPAVPKQPAATSQLPAELANPSAGSALAEAPPMESEAPVPSIDVEPAAQPEPVQEQEQEPVVPDTETTNEPAEAALSAPQAPLTEDNVENLPDVSQPPATHTAASTVGSLDPRTITPLVPGQQAPIGRPPIGGFASSAYRATAVPGRSASYQRRVLDQQEAVVMPGHNAVDRAAVQFGSMGLNGDSESLDVDEEREEPETRTQPPQQSPAQPRASLPPAPVQSSSSQQDMGLPESLLTPKPAPGLGAPSHQHQQQTFGLPHENAAAAAPQVAPQDSFSSQQYSQYGRYGQPETSAPSQKSYDPFSHQTPSSAFDQYSSQQSQPSSQQHGYGGFSSAPSDYSHYYTADQQRNAYQNYYGSSYGQQNAQSQQDGGAAQRTSSSIGASASESAFPSAQGSQQVGPTIPLVSALMQRDLQQKLSNGTPEATRVARRSSGAFESSNKENSCVLSFDPFCSSDRADVSSQGQSRYNDTQGSGQDSSLMGGQQQGAAPSHQMHQQQHQQHQAHAAYNSGYPYGHPYYQSPYQTAYQNQFGYSGGYGGAPYGSKGGMYGQPQHYGMNAPSAYEQHASSPATGGFGQQSSMQSRETGLGGGSLGEYGRTPSSQPAGLGSGSGSFGSSDPFARTQSGYGGQTQSYGQQSQNYGQQQTQSYGQQQGQNYGQQQSAASEDLKPFGDSKATGPSPAMGQPGRPGSAANSVGNQSQSGLPPPQSQQQQGFGGYPGFNQGSQYGGLGGLGGHQGQGQQGAYGNAYGGGFGNSYSQQYGRGGWGGNYGH